MFKTKKTIRKGPTESATLFSEGTTKLGNDGNTWIIVVTDAGVHRWSRVKKQTSEPKLKNIVKNKTVKIKTALSEPIEEISQETLIKMTKKGTAHIHRCVELSEVNKELKAGPPK